MIAEQGMCRLAESYRGPASLLERPVDEVLVRELLAEVGGTRLSHVEGVVRLARECIGILKIEESDEARDLLQAAWFHDAGYAPVLKQSDFTLWMARPSWRRPERVRR